MNRKKAKLQHKLLLLFSTAIVLIFVLGAMATVVLAAGECYESYTENDDTATRAMAVYWKAQSFTPECSHYVNRIELKLYRSGLPGWGTISIRATDDSEKPVGEDLTSAAIDGNSLTGDTSSEWYTFAVPSIWLEAGTQYAILYRFPDGTYPHIFGAGRCDSTNSTYIGGCLMYSGDEGTTWLKLDGIETPTNEDIIFREYNSASSGSVLIAIIPFVWAVLGVVAVFKFLGDKGMMTVGIGLLMVGLLTAVGYVVLNAILS